MPHAIRCRANRHRAAGVQSETNVKCLDATPISPPETFDYHWLVRWNFFFQREEPEFRAIFAAGGVHDNSISVERDDSGVLLFFTIRK